MQNTGLFCRALLQKRPINLLYVTLYVVCYYRLRHRLIDEMEEVFYHLFTGLFCRALLQKRPINLRHRLIDETEEVFYHLFHLFYQKRPVLFQKSLIFQRAPYSISKEPSIKRDLYSFKRALYSKEPYILYQRSPIF